MATVWVVIEHIEFETTLALVADSLESAQRGAANYVGEESLGWYRRNSIFDGQDYLVATHDGDEYHIFEQEVEHHGKGDGDQ